MAEDPESLALRSLRRRDEGIDRPAGALADPPSDSRELKSRMAGPMRNEVAQDGATASSKVRSHRMERRLDPQEPRA